MLKRTAARDAGVLVLGFFVAACLCASGLIVISGSNAALFLWLNRASAQWLPDSIPALITAFGEGYWSLALIAPLLLSAPRVTAAILYSAPFVLSFTHIPKTLLPMARPSAVFSEGVAHFINAPTSMNAFPSGHAVVATAMATVVILGNDNVRRQLGATVFVLSFWTLVAATRIAVGAHWPTDVLAGAAAGCVSGWLGVRLTYRFTHWRTHNGRELVSVLFVANALFLASGPSQHPHDILLRGVLACVCAGCALATLIQLRDGVDDLNATAEDTRPGVNRVLLP